MNNGFHGGKMLGSTEKETDIITWKKQENLNGQSSTWVTY